MERYVLAGAVLASTIAGAVLFRFDMQVLTPSPVGVVLVTDRWTGDVRICHRVSLAETACDPFMSAYAVPPASKKALDASVERTIWELGLVPSGTGR